MADVKWIKLNVNMFDNRKIKHIRKLPAGNEIVLIWVMLLTLAGRCNAGGMIFLTENIPYSAKMLADELDFEESTVKLALEALEQLGMLSTNENGFLAVPGWEKHQNIDGMERIREQNRVRKARYDERKRLEKTASSVTGNATVTQSNSTDIDKEEDKDIDKEYISIVDYLNQKAGTRYRASTPKTKKAIHSRLAEGFTVEDFKTVISKKCEEWIGTEWEKFLRPETLFGTKFESYLNAKNGKGEKHGRAESDDPAGAAIGTWL